MTIPTPTLDKIHAVLKESQAIGEFLDWLQMRGVTLAETHHHTKECFAEEDFFYGNLKMKYCGYQDNDLQPAGKTIEAWLAEYFEIDLMLAEKERAAILKELQERNRT